MLPIICTKDSLLDAASRKDYGTCTSVYHRFIPDIPQHFDCRVKAKIKKGLLDRDIALRDDVKSTYNNEYIPKCNQDNANQFYDRPIQQDHVQLMRNVREKLCEHLPPPIAPKISVMKSSYGVTYQRMRCRDIPSPAIEGICDISGLERSLQPLVPPESKCYWKLLDNYLTENKLQYVPYNSDEMKRSNGSDKDKNVTVPVSGNKSIFDKSIFKTQFPNKFLSRGQRRCPNFGIKTEYRSNYKPQSYSDLYPYISENGVHFEESLSEASAWQNLCAPGMYCSEAYHIGSGWSVRDVVDIGNKKPKNDIIGEDLNK